MKKGKSDFKVENGLSVEDVYQKKTQLEHILLRPDTYIGSVQRIEDKTWVCQNEKFEYKSISYVPGLFKIFDEILVNANDNIQRDASMTQIKVEIEKEKNRISVYNNGRGIPVVIHKEHKVYVPELIFGHLLTSSNYDDTIKKVTGGRNGFGAKLTNVFSKKFTVETADSKNKKKYVQVFSKNMSEIKEAEISAYSDKDYTKITFEPDLSKFGMKELDEDTVSLLTKRVYDIAGTSPPNVSVYLNNKKIAIKNFREYADLYFKDNLFDGKIEYPKIHEKPNSRWEVILSMSDAQLSQCSFVNGICTSKGGTHVNYVLDQVVDKISEHIKKKHKDLKLKAPQIKQNLWIFVNSMVENPTFSSQSKETMTLNVSDFGSKCELSEKFFKEVLKSPVVANIVDFFKAKEKVKLHKALSSSIKKSSRLLGIEKLEDANEAGTKNSELCTLILTEGDSAKALAMSGLEVVGRDRFGVFPLKGKLLNVRDANQNSIIANEEIQNLIKILGLQMNRNYESDVKSLRYGRLMIMADQDFDGSHIKGLIMNFIHFFWPSLIKRNGFVKEFVTPIVKVSKGDEAKCFYTLKEYTEWYETHKHSNWKIKYYKGLGTSTPAEAKDYFKAMQKNKIDFTYLNEEDDKSIELAFSKANANLRKEWLANFDSSVYIDHSKSEIRIKDFVDKELIFFSNADNIRSIPNAVDGLKPSERKILYSCFKRNLKGELKVAQLAGYVAEHSCYHHGEASLCATIVALAQDFTGTNNLNLLMPIGQFGNRYSGSKGAASARYIYTCLSRLTRKVFREEDDHLLTYCVEEGTKIEPVHYTPILPMLLVNGSEGIGTGWATSVPQFDPREVAASLLRKLDGGDYKDMRPWFKGFQGEVSDPANKNGFASYTVSGRVNLEGDRTVEIVELPVHTWTRDYKTFLERHHVDSKDSEGLDFQVEDVKEYHTENYIHFKVKFNEESYAKLESMTTEERLKVLKLTTPISTSNMVAFDTLGKIKKYNNVNEIIDEFYHLRLEFYTRRKEYLLAKLNYHLEVSTNKLNFIKMFLSGSNPLRNLKKSEIFNTLKVNGFLSHSELKKKYKSAFKINTTDLLVEEQDNSDSNSDFDYLMNMNIWSLTQERIEDLEKSIASGSCDISILETTCEKDMWRRDLNEFLLEYEAFLNNIVPRKIRVIQQNKVTNGRSKGGKVQSKAATNKKAKNREDFILDDDEESASEDSDSNSEDSSGSESYYSEKKPKAKPTETETKQTPKKKNNKMIVEDDEEDYTQEKKLSRVNNVNNITKASQTKSKPAMEINSLPKPALNTETSHFIKSLNLESKPTNVDPSKMSLKERLALRATQGKIEQYLSIIKEKSIVLVKQDPPSKEIEVEELLGLKRGSDLDMEKQLKQTDDGLEDPSTRSRRQIPRKKIIDDDSDHE